jgi:hypothetical protein
MAPNAVVQPRRLVGAHQLAGGRLLRERAAHVKHGRGGLGAGQSGAKSWKNSGKVPMTPRPMRIREMVSARPVSNGLVR